MEKQIERRVQITIYALPIENGSVNHHTQKEVLRVYDLPRWQYEASAHRIEWIRSRFRYYNPRLHIDTGYYHYRVDGKDLTATYKLSSRKGERTKLLNAMQKYKSTWNPTLLMHSIEEDAVWQKATAKLEKIENELKALEEVLK